MSRPILQNVTNSRVLNVQSTKRPADTQNGGPVKKIKISPKGDSSDDDEPICRLFPRGHGLSSTSGRYICPYSSTTPFLRSFVTSDKSDVFKCVSLDEATFLTPPYACAYSHAAKRGGLQLLAVATEQGTVDIWETSKRDPWDPEPLRNKLYPHKSGVFSLQWSNSDELLVTCCGDRTARISNVATSTTMHTLNGHTGTLKCAAWNPNHPDMLSTGGRDGMICIWDLRAGETGTEGSLSPVRMITRAHETLPPGRKSGKGAVAKSVTGLAHSCLSPHELISSGSFDGILRAWDLRASSSSNKKFVPLRISPEDSTLNQGARRPRGLLNLIPGTGPTAGLMFSLGVDGRIHTYALPSLLPLKPSPTHRNLQVTAFYIGLGLSPCGNWLASGSVGTSASAFLFDVSNAGRPFAKPSPGVQLQAPRGEVGAVDWGNGALATCGDDGVVRVWRPDIEQYAKCQENPEEMKWEWSWAENRGQVA